MIATIESATHQTEDPGTYEVVVVGGGPAGLAAAIAAGRMGVKVALVERHDVLGGMGTAALVNNFCPAHLDGQRLIIGGIFAELRERLIQRKAIFAAPNFEYRMEPYHPSVFAEESEQMARAAGVAIYFGQSIRKMHFESNERSTLVLTDGTQLLGRTVVDATGDALVAAAAGVPCRFGRLSDGAVMPLTFCYKLGPIDLDTVQKDMPHTISYDERVGQLSLTISGAHQKVAAAQANGELSIPRDHVASIMNIPGEPENATVNFGRVFIKDPTDPLQLAEAEKQGREQITEGVRFFRKYLPGFEHAEVLETARQIGVRESRQIIGLYTLTGEDVLSCRQFDDVIAQCCYAVDIHDPDSSGTHMTELERGTHFDIPLRCLIPASGPENLIVAGRSVSATQEAMSSFRVSPSVMAIGEAAGVAAALAAQTDCSMRQLDPAIVQARLHATGAILT
jgi:glycine/D-amino acid oxidase-like deaminating enzyme